MTILLKREKTEFKSHFCMSHLQISQFLVFEFSLWNEPGNEPGAKVLQVVSTDDSLRFFKILYAFDFGKNKIK